MSKKKAEGEEKEQAVAENVEEEKKDIAKVREEIIEEGGEEKAERRERRKEIEAVVNIYTSFNNTVVHVTDMSGRTLAKVSGGMVTKHNRLKANPTIAMFIAKRISEQIKEYAITSLFVKIRAQTGNPAPGPGAHAIIKSLSREGFKILNIMDTTRVPRGGPKKKGGRRGRRV